MVVLVCSLLVVMLISTLMVENISLDVPDSSAEVSPRSSLLISQVCCPVSKFYADSAVCCVSSNCLLLTSLTCPTASNGSKKYQWAVNIIIITAPYVDCWSRYSAIGVALSCYYHLGKNLEERDEATLGVRYRDHNFIDVMICSTLLSLILLSFHFQFPSKVSPIIQAVAYV